MTNPIRRKLKHAEAEIASVYQELNAVLARLDDIQRELAECSKDLGPSRDRHLIPTMISDIIRASGPRGISSGDIGKKLEAAGQDVKPATLRSQISRMKSRGEIRGRPGLGSTRWTATASPNTDPKLIIEPKMEDEMPP